MKKTIFLLIVLVGITLCACQTGQSIRYRHAPSLPDFSAEASSSSAIIGATSSDTAASSSSTGVSSAGTASPASSSTNTQENKQLPSTPTPTAPGTSPAPEGIVWPDGGAVPQPLSIPDMDGQHVAQNNAAIIDLSYVSYGFVKIQLKQPIASPTAVKVVIHWGTDPNANNYNYNLDRNGKSESYPLQMGNGTYAITVASQISGDKYSVLNATTVNVTLASALSPFLVPSQYISYNSSAQSTALARALVAGKSNNYERVSAVLTYVASTLSYDYEEAASVQRGYVPDINAVLSRKKGICFDYSATAAAMLRSLGYPTRMIFGYVENGTVYHAWDEVYFSGTGWVRVMSVTLNTSGWSRVDCTFVSTAKSPDAIQKYIQNAGNYQNVLVY